MPACVPRGWDAPQFRPDKRWLPAMLLRGAADKPSMQTSGPDYLLGADSADQHRQATASIHPAVAECGNPGGQDDRVRPRDLAARSG